MNFLGRGLGEKRGMGITKEGGANITERGEEKGSRKEKEMKDAGVKKRAKRSLGRGGPKKGFVGTKTRTRGV